MASIDLRWRQRFDSYPRALRQLTAAVALYRTRPLPELERQGLIQGVEFSHELAWNVLEDHLEFEGIQGLVGSRSTAREALKRGRASPKWKRPSCSQKHGCARTRASAEAFFP